MPNVPDAAIDFAKHLSNPENSNRIRAERAFPMLPFRTALVMNLEPLMSTLGSIVLLGEVMQPAQRLVTERLRKPWAACAAPEAPWVQQPLAPMRKR